MNLSGFKLRFNFKIGWIYQDLNSDLISRFEIFKNNLEGGVTNPNSGHEILSFLPLRRYPIKQTIKQNSYPVTLIWPLYLMKAIGADIQFCLQKQKMQIQGHYLITISVKDKVFFINFREFSTDPCWFYTFRIFSEGISKCS